MLTQDGRDIQANIPPLQVEQRQTEVHPLLVLVCGSTQMVLMNHRSAAAGGGRRRAQGQSLRTSIQNGPDEFAWAKPRRTQCCSIAPWSTLSICMCCCAEGRTELYLLLSVDVL